MDAVLYLSQNTGFDNELEIQDMVRLAQETNAMHEITGYLYFSNNQFVQYFEGEREKVSPLWDNIQKDSRHVLLFSSRSEIESRRFNTWYMRDWTSSTRVESFLNEYLSEQMTYLSNKQPGFLGSIFNKDSKIWKILDNICKATSPMTPEV